MPAVVFPGEVGGAVGKISVLPLGVQSVGVAVGCAVGVAGGSAVVWLGSAVGVEIK